MEFKQNIVKASKRSKDGLTKGQVIYTDYDVFLIDVKGKEYKVNAYDFMNVNTLYSKPTNDSYEAWTSKVAKLTVEYRFKVISKYWSTIKDKQYIRGKIEDGEFIIVKY